MTLQVHPLSSPADAGDALWAIENLKTVLASIPEAAIAVSGGVDSMTLAHVAMTLLPQKAVVFHAVSPAVPASASDRVRAHSARYGWDLRLVDAGEMRDPRYVTNPVNRCYFCKTNLYAFIRQVWSGPLFSGANLDDLSDYRPGLIAAAEHEVRHPFIEAEIDKAHVRAIARHLHLDDLADLPAQPCLSSRVETGRAINPKHLLMIDRIESAMRERLGPVDLRCRIRQQGVVIEIDGGVLPKLDRATRAAMKQLCEQESAEAGLAFSGFEEYVRGSAFVGKPKLDTKNRSDWK